MIRAVLDTNVIVSALVFGGTPRTILERAEVRGYGWFYSEPIQAEVRVVLDRKFGWRPEMLRDVLTRLWSIGELVRPTISVQAVVEDPDDDRVLECALASRADFIVSGDHHLLAVGNYEGTAIVSPRRFIEANWLNVSR